MTGAQTVDTTPAQRAGACVTASESPIIIDHFRTLAADRDLLLCDVWGVIHNGIRIGPGVIEALGAFRTGGGTIVLVSNAPRPAPSIYAQLDQLGLPRDCYDSIVTSGDMTRGFILAEASPALHHIGPDRDLPLFEDLPIERVPLADAHFVVCSGLIDDETETADDYRATLEAMRVRNLHMLCANPDLVVERGDKLIPCAGAIALLYEEMGGRVTYGGKPHRPVYEKALEVARTLRGAAVDRARVLAVGDAIRTDVMGAATVGVDCLFMADGIHGHLLLDDARSLEAGKLSRFLDGQAVRPRYAMTRLVW